MNYLVLDLETANPDCASICQIGIVKVESGETTATISHLIDPQDRFDHWNIKVHGIQPHHVVGCPSFCELLPELMPLLEGQIIVTHGSFDRVAITKACQKYGLPAVEATWLDNQTVVRRTWPQFSRKGYSLGNLANHFGIEFQHHDALEDAIATAHIFRRALAESGRTASQWVSAMGQRGPHQGAILQHGSSDGPFAGKTVVFTGRMQITRQEAARRAAALGFTVAAAVSPTTTLLCVGDDRNRVGKSSKERDAERLLLAGHPISIMAEHEFWRLLSA
ncbi:exonuclease domain-containing protein [Microvirga lenta]|uniref:exonuclease domain-containing protein n=1 Tax=Microvirga lenta TaxID=2881337 RepID=UPI001CFF58D2|nr:exonuclease domain-containing protein [Microvirga lenta]MCB5177070.1 3'-5' exoribonuclease [Microvirga lenta]